MREIKFRAWHKKRKELLKVDIIDLKNKTIEVDCETIPFEDVVLEQETGLPDKNKQMIYDGDILVLDESTYDIQWSDGYGGIQCVCEPVFDGKLYGVVRFSAHNGFIVNIVKIYDTNNGEWKKEKTTRKLKSKEKREVIGNIHENGDLLK